MIAPILVPAFPAVLRVGLVVVPAKGSIGGSAAIVAIGGGDVMLCETGKWGAYSSAAERIFVRPTTALRLDLRDPAVRDDVVRAIWRKLRPTEPEPLTAPRWDNNSERRYSLVGRHMRDVSDTTYDVRFRPTPGGRSPEYEDIVVPALGDLPRDSFDRPQDFADRDLLALAEVAKAVLS